MARTRILRVELRASYDRKAQPQIPRKARLERREKLANALCSLEIRHDDRAELQRPFRRLVQPMIDRDTRLDHEYALA
jgi:hypothetical protein